MKHLLIALLKAYRFAISPLYGQVCRYYPSCSAYALASVERHGALKGGWLAARRLGRCHPWCAGGVDLVPSIADYRWWGRCAGADGGPSVFDEHSDAVTLALPSSRSTFNPHISRGA
jgi:hypothetical protein